MCICMERMKAILTLTAALAFALSPLTTQGFNGFRPDQFPVPQVDPPVQPAGYAFALWGLIYLWLVAGSAYGLLMRDTAPGWDRARWPLIASLVMGAAWIPVAQLSVPWATVLIWLMLAGALAALLRADHQDRWWLEGPVGLYAGWLTAAASVALGLLLAGYGVTGPVTAAILALTLALGLGLWALVLRPGALSYAAGLAWALIGVVVANATRDGGNAAVIMLCTGGLGVLAWITLHGWRARQAQG